MFTPVICPDCIGGVDAGLPGRCRARKIVRIVPSAWRGLTMTTFYRMAHAVERIGDCRWPYDIGIAFDDTPCPVGFAEGIGQGVGAITVTASDAVSATWQRHFEATSSEWLLPYLRRLVMGMPLPRAQMFAEYAAIHGSPPPVSTLWD